MCARSFEILFVAAVRDAGSRRARRKAAFAGLGSKVHHRAVQLLTVSARLQPGRIKYTLYLYLNTYTYTYTYNYTYTYTRRPAKVWSASRVTRTLRGKEAAVAVGSVSPPPSFWSARLLDHFAWRKKHRSSAACTKHRSAHSHSQSAFDRGPNGGGGEDVPALLGG